MALSDIIARLAVSLEMDTVAFEKGATLAEKRMVSMTKKLQAVGKKMTGIGKSLSLGITAPFAAIAVKSVKGAQEQAAAMAQVEAALKSMGDASGKTSAELLKNADAFEMRSLFNADVILKEVTANLLTFGNVAGEQFDRAQQSALDMAERLGTGPQAAAIMLGKALNDPIKGISALTRVGVQFTEKQKDTIEAMVKVGDTAGAQGIILDEVSRQFAGAAQAAADATPWRQASVAIDQAMDKIGEAILPIIPPITDAIVAMATAFSNLSPTMQKNIVIVAALVAAVGPVLIVFGSLVTATAPLISLLIALGPAIALVSKALLLMALNPVIIGLAVLIGGIYLAWRNWDKIEPIIRNLYNGVKTWIIDKLGKVFDWVMGKVRAVGAVFEWLYDAVVGNSYIPDMVDGIAAHMARLDAVMVKPVENATSKAGKAFRDMADDVRALLDRLFPGVRASLNFEDDLALLEKAGLSAGDLSDAQARLRRSQFTVLDTTNKGNRSIGILQGGDEPLTKFGDALDKLAEKAKATSVVVAKTFKDMADDTINALQRMTDAIKGGGFLDILGAVINLGLQLGSIGAFGKNVAAKINKIPGNATGTDYWRGGLTFVGERGPELVSLPRGSRITPNNELGGMTRIQVEASPYFDVRVNGQIQRAAPAIVSAGGQVGMTRMRYANSRRVA